MGNVINIDNKNININNLNKIYWPEEGFTKAHLIRYYAEIGEFLLPHLHNRPFVMSRYPDGIFGKTFYQKDRPSHTPDWVETFQTYRENGEPITYCLCNDMATLIWLVSQGCIEMHPWLSQIDMIEYPDFIVFDLDPEEPATFANVVEVALFLRRVLEQLELKVYPKTSGATGLHLYLPIKRRYPYSEIREFAKLIGSIALREMPELVTLERSVAKRRGIYIDYLQNVEGKTIASVYSVRPRTGAPVSLPVTWEELENRQIQPRSFHIGNVATRLAQVGDLFAPVLQHTFEIDKSLAVLQGTVKF